MKIYHGFNDKALKFKKRAIAIGVFDGVHRGHEKILSHMMADAKGHGISPVVVTFDPHPAKILSPKQFHPTILMSLPHRLQFFQSMGIEEVIVVPFTKAFSRIPRERFLKTLLSLGMDSLTVGHDFRFGAKALGDGVYLKQMMKPIGKRLCLVDAFKIAGEVVSSSRIRVLIEGGYLQSASRMLGRPVSVVGTVVHGRGRGKSTGFPTANLNPHHEALPPAAVYAAYGFLGKKKLRGVLHIGTRPTFGDRQKSLEIHFLGFHQRIYGRQIELIFVKKLRDIRRFKDAAELAGAITSDIRRAQKYL